MPKTPDATDKQPSITVTLEPAFHAYVLQEAKKDDRKPANWLKRYIQNSIPPPTVSEK